MFKLLLIITILYLVSSCSSEMSEDNLLSIPVEVSVIRDSVNWIDEDTILFVDNYDGKRKVLRWNIKANHVDVYADEALGGLCYHDGYIFYPVRIDGRKTFYKEGVIGSEKEFINNWDDPERKKIKRNSFTCKEYVRDEKYYGMRVAYLNDEHGKIVYERGVSSRGHAVYFIGVDGKKVDLSVIKYFDAGGMRYYAFKNAYFVFSRSLNVKTSGCDYAYWLYPDGRIEEVCVPRINNGGKGIYMIPAKDRYLILTAISDQSDVINSVLYVTDDMGSYQKLISGVMGHFSVSKNGCKIAFTHGDKRFYENKLKVLDVCNIYD